MHESVKIEQVYLALCKAANTPVSLGCWLRFKYSHEELAKVDIRPEDYLDPDSFKIDYAIVSYLSKYKGLKTGIDTEAEALRRFTLAEHQCAEANRTIRNLRRGQSSPVHAVLHSAQRKIARLIGPFSLFHIEGREGWGPGATLEIPRRRAFPDTKMCELPITVTRNALDYFKSVIETDLHWSYTILSMFPEGPYSLLPSTFRVVDGNRLETVPKNAKTDRVIAIEPRGNSFLQKSVGDYLRSRLKRVGVDLNDQTRNQSLAGKAIELDLATIDLSMASDTVCLELVYELLPLDWAMFLDALRCPYTAMPDGTPIRLEKFSSMGNGFTFELESLVFWAITQAITDDKCPGGVVAVYGDDIICQKQVAEEVIAALGVVGFKTNVEKSHVSGQFYESCGKHFFGDKDVTPAYQKEVPDSYPEAIRLGNRLIRLADRLGGGSGLDLRIFNAWSAARRLYPDSSGLQLPLGSEGDDGWLVPFDEFKFGKTEPSRGVRCRVFRKLQVAFPGYDEALLALTLRLRATSGTPVKEHRERRGMHHLRRFGDPVLDKHGMLSREKEVYTLSYRWVVPVGGKFCLKWR